MHYYHLQLKNPTLIGTSTFCKCKAYRKSIVKYVVVKHEESFQAKYLTSLRFKHECIFTYNCSIEILVRQACKQAFR